MVKLMKMSIQMILQWFHVGPVYKTFPFSVVFLSSSNSIKYFQIDELAVTTGWLKFLRFIGPCGPMP
jgi:hypothetical protein